MVADKQIKVIKRAERRESQASPPEKGRGDGPEAGETAKRDAVTVVTGWVQELRQKKSEEAAQGFEGLFRKVA